MSSQESETFSLCFAFTRANEGFAKTLVVSHFVTFRPGRLAKHVSMRSRELSLPLDFAREAKAFLCFRDCFRT